MAAEHCFSLDEFLRYFSRHYPWVNGEIGNAVVLHTTVSPISHLELYHYNFPRYRYVVMCPNAGTGFKVTI